jgi:hypothetical protein
MNEQILKVLSSQKFADWYFSGNFAEYLENDSGLKEQILEEIEVMFGTDKSSLGKLYLESVFFK